MRISHIAFTADENFLVLTAESGGGLAVYDVQAVLNGSQDSIFQLSTNGTPVRALIPNPTPEKGELVAVVTTDGKLMMASLTERRFLDGGNGQILKEGVSCIAWSTKGKQLVAGLGDGTATQMTPEGAAKAQIPAPPSMAANNHISTISWLENNVFLIVHTPSDGDNSMAPASTFHVVTRHNQNASEFLFQKISDPAPPFGLNRSPPHHFMLRLKDFPPSIKDILIVASSASTDIGTFTRSESPLASDKPADKITGVFTMTEMSIDSRRAQLPVTEDMNDTSPIGMTLDLSSPDKVLKPIPSEEMDQSSTPLPALMVLNNEGVLASWWIVYNDSIRQGTAYPGLVAAGAQQVNQATSVSKVPSSNSVFGSTASAPAFGQSAFGTSASQGSAFGSTFAKPATPALGSSAFGAGSGSGTGVAFGVGGGLGKAASPWGTPASGSATAPATGSVFGASSTPGHSLTFGSSAMPGSKPSPWGTPGTTTAPAFGQSSSLGLNKPSVFGASTGTGAFGSNTSSAPVSGGFASFANSNGFAAAAANSSNDGQSIFGASKAPNTTFGGAQNTPTAASSGIFGGSFKLGSTFTPDDSAKEQPTTTSAPSTQSLFGNGFGKVLGEVESQPSQNETPEADMDADETEKEAISSDETAKTNFGQGTTTPAATPALNKFMPPAASPPIKGSLFGKSFAPTASSPLSKPTSSIFGASQETGSKASIFGQSQSKTTSESKSTGSGIFGLGSPSPFSQIGGTKIKEEPAEETTTKDILKATQEAPLPPDTTSKTSFAAGNSSSSSEADAPLPPDFMPSTSTKKVDSHLPVVPEESKANVISADLIPPTDVPGGPEEDGDSDFGSEDGSGSGFEGSGEDVTKDLSPASDETPAFTPEISSKSTLTRGESSSFTNISFPSQSIATRPLFGEITNAPVLAPPASRPIASPRSPSPQRGLASRVMRSDAARSVSTPVAASNILAKKAPTGPSDTFAKTLEQRHEESRRQADSRARQEAEEAQALIDEEDESAQKYLSSPIRPTRYLDDFVAHQDYVGNADKNSIPAQVEAVYRDINSMVDTLGINARALANFIQGHSEVERDSPRTREDLEDPEGWCLVEIEDLDSIVSRDLTKDLASGRVKDVPSKVDVCDALERDLTKLRSKQEDMQTLLAAQSGADETAMVRAQPLTPEQATQQHELRRIYTTFQKLLGEAEDGLSMLRAKLASHSGLHGKSNASPTVEAVIKTITKMTTMAEKRSGDVDVLENQMRKLRMSSLASERGSRKDSPFATPVKRMSIRAPGTASTIGEFYTPPSGRYESPSHFRHSIASSVNSTTRASPARKKISGFSEEEKTILKEKASQRRDVIEKLRAALQNSGTRMRLMNDEAKTSVG